MKPGALWALWALCSALPLPRAMAQAPSSLPLDGSPLTLAAPADERLVVELRGTVTCTTDGLMLDAMGFPRGDADSGRALVRLPEGTQILESDRDLGRYIVQLPPGDATLLFDARPLLGDRTVSRAQALWSLSGAIEVRVVELEAAAIVATPGSESESERRPLAAGALALLAFALGGMALQRRRRGRHGLGRARRAAAAVRREARRLGPSFAPTLDHCAEVLRAAEAAQGHAETSEAALRRTRHLVSDGAAARRLELADRLIAVRSRIAELADRLEVTAAQLAEHDAARARPQELERLLQALEEDVALGVRAEVEAGLV